MGFILAGGQSHRMGTQDKCLLPLGDKTILDHVINHVRPQVDTLVLNANGEPSRFQQVDLPIVADVIPGPRDHVIADRFIGPLAGVLTGMAWTMDNAPNCNWLATFPADTPFIPDGLVQKLFAAVSIPANQLACARSNGRCHFAVGLWPISLYEPLKEALVVEGVRKTGQWLRRYSYGCADYGHQPRDPFFNINTPDDLKIANRLLGENRK